MAGAFPQHLIIPNGLDSLHPFLDRRGLCTYCDVHWPVGGPNPVPGPCPQITGPLGFIAENSFMVCPNPSHNHLQHPNPAAASFNRWYIMCTRARNDLKTRIIPQAQEVFGRPIIERLPDGTVSKINNSNNIGGLGPGGPAAPTNANMPQRSMSYLCTICTADELRHYFNRISNADYVSIVSPSVSQVVRNVSDICTGETSSSSSGGGKWLYKYLYLHQQGCSKQPSGEPPSSRLRRLYSLADRGPAHTGNALS